MNVGNDHYAYAYAGKLPYLDQWNTRIAQHHKPVTWDVTITNVDYNQNKTRGPESFMLYGYFETP